MPSLHHGVEQDPFNDEAGWADAADSVALLRTSAPSRPTTPRRSTSTRSVSSRNSPGKSGIVFGTPRIKRRPSNPFSDLQAGQYASTDNFTPIAPAPSVVYNRRVPDETESSMLRHAHATPANEQEDFDEKNDPAVGFLLDDEEKTIHQKTERDYLKGDTKIGRSLFTYFRRRRRPYSPIDVTSTSTRPVLARFRKLFIFVIVTVVLATILFILAVLNSRQPAVHWKGTLSDSTGALETTGFNFTRHIDLGFTNPNLFPMDLVGVTVWAAYQDSFYFGLSSNDHVGLEITGLNRRNASLPMEMNFAYISSDDPANDYLKALIVECGNTGMLNFEMIVHAKVKALKFIPYTVKFARLDASMTCDNNMAILAQEMLVKAQPDGVA